MSQKNWIVPSLVKWDQVEIGIFVVFEEMGFVYRYSPSPHAYILFLSFSLALFWLLTLILSSPLTHSPIHSLTHSLTHLFRRRGKDKTGHTHNGSLLAYADPAGEKLLANQGTLPR